jgi:NAD(P)-dependent dehydrogenase (short-subunit alcohol dehydrogenase family)
VALVTGAGRGIGKAIALALADAGADVVVAARTAADIEATALEIEEKKRRALGITADTRDSEQITNVIEQTMNTFGKIDILVNNVGGTIPATTLEISEGLWDAIVRTNLKSAFLCSQAVSKIMVLEHRGVIVNIASMVGLVSNPYNAAYGAAKAGMINLTRTMAIDLAKFNIRVNAIAPGYIGTSEMAKHFDAQPNLAKQIPLSHLGAPEDIANAVVYLASDAAGYVTGSVIVVDGGLSSKPTLEL